MKLKSKTTRPAGNLAKQQAVPVSENRLISSCPIVLKFDDTLPQIFTDIIYAWKKLGNPWVSPLEAELQLYTKKLTFENPINDIYAIKALVFLGYMEQQTYTRAAYVSKCERYRLSRKGIQAGNLIAQKLGDKTTDIEVSETTAECEKCKGEGMITSEDGIDNVCSFCKGIGRVNKIPAAVKTKIAVSKDKDIDFFPEKNVVPPKPKTRLVSRR